MVILVIYDKIRGNTLWLYKMDILIDTNIFIYRENNRVVPRDLQELERSLKDEGHRILIHPLSKREIRNDGNADRRQKAESKVEAYVELEYPTYPSERDTQFRSEIKEVADFNEKVDNSLLYAVFKDKVEFLITEDGGIHEKALRLGLEDRVFTIEDGRDFFKEQPPEVYGPPSIERTRVGELDVNDPIFDSLKGEYDFEHWFESISERTAYVSRENEGELGAILIIKPNEIENIGNNPPLGKKERLKISTLKVSKDRWGSKIGELLINISIREALNRGINEIYLTHYSEDRDYFVEVIRTYGFIKTSEKRDGEDIYIKKLTPGPSDNPSSLAATQQFFPTFCDWSRIKKFLVPIRPKWHSKLFTGYKKRQPKLQEFSGNFIPEGNAIKKAYLTNAKTRQIEPGSLLLFYRTTDEKEVTSLGVCEQVKYGLTDADDILRTVGRRSVFSDQEVEEMVSSPTTVILFWHNFDLENPVSYHGLLENEVLSGPPQTLQQIDEEGYKYIKREGEIDERFALD